MDVELDKVDGAAVESYHVRMQESDSSGAHVVLGMVERASPSTWSFRPIVPMTRRKGEAPTFSSEAAVTLKAADAGELRHVIEQRFGTIDLPADRLRDETTARIAYDVLRGVLQLARRTNSIAGFSKAVAQVVAHIIAEDLKADHEQPFRAALHGQIDASVQSIREAKRVSDAITERLSHMFKPADDDEPQAETKH